MEWADFANKRVGLLGAGVENLALIPYLKKAGASITICNQTDHPRLNSWTSNEAVKVVIGPNYLDNLDNYDIVFRIPGMPVKLLAQKLAKLEHRPLATSAINLFLELCPCPVIGVTGTKGKGTTSVMIAAILEQTGRTVFVGANINNAVFSFFDQLTPESLVVLELSSFQLEDVTHSPDVAVLLPVTAEHLQPLAISNPNYHESLADYVKAKAQITAWQTEQDTLVFAKDSPTARKIADQTKAKKISVGQTNADIEVNLTGQLTQDGQPYLDLTRAGFKGSHIFLDAGLAVAVGQLFNLKAEQILQGLSNFQPLPHRLEVFKQVKDVTYVDDSYATAPDATEAALTAFKQPIIWLAGGSPKGVDFVPLAQAVNRSTVRLALLIGQEAERLREVLAKEAPRLRVEIGSSLEELVSLAKAEAKPGEIVLLSPACASTDMFESAAQRGDQFKVLVSQAE